MQILSPAKGVIYHLREGAGNRLPLKASVSDSAHTVFWFVGPIPLGKSTPEGTVFWPLKRGTYVIRIIDDGNHAASRKVTGE